ncbi:MAG: hypothetical protein P1U64_13185 [Alcanivoracaceae bacterium]|nr:hypothetical protein [Alcanivoracaceae bacterium]
MSEPINQGGLSRWGFVLVLVLWLFTIFAWALVGGLLGMGPVENLTFILYVGFIIFCSAIFLTAAAFRIKNIGYSKWFTLTILLPFIGSIAMIPIIALPAGYKTRRKLDLSAYILMAAAFVILFIPSILLSMDPKFIGRLI